MEYLHHVDGDNSVKHFNRWRFFDFNKVYEQSVTPELT